MKNLRRRGAMLTALCLMATMVVGCTTDQGQAQPAPTVTVMVTPEPPEPKAGETPISEAHVCGQVSSLLTLAANTSVGALEAGLISQAERDTGEAIIALGYRYLLVGVRGAVGTAAQNLSEYVTSTPPGAAVDMTSPEWRRLMGEMHEACTDAGSGVTAMVGFGG